MKRHRIFLSCLLFFLLFYIRSFTSLAGDIPEALLQKDYPVYFGKVTEVSEQNIVILPVQRIKGNVIVGREIFYNDYGFTKNPNIGQIYLCGYFDANNPLYIWEVDCCDTAMLTIKNTDNMSKRMQQYLNDGLFEKAAEKDRKPFIAACQLMPFTAMTKLLTIAFSNIECAAE